MLALFYRFKIVAGATVTGVQECSALVQLGVVVVSNLQRVAVALRFRQRADVHYNHTHDNL